ncbi:MAG: cofactor-independent phosphoglycerate mutase [Deltaproteobacteria bacterium]|nr:cofactor-independent phosphoglycerate mutase [Deltaproteobacteria bacterium]
MADYPLRELDGKTPLEAAETPHMDRIAACRVGLVKTIPDGVEPGSDVANLSILGYDPLKYNSGRGPLEAASMSLSLKPNQVVFRMNLVCLDRRSENEIIMISHSSGDISTEEAVKIVESIERELKSETIAIYPGVAYRHLLVWENGPEDALTIPPHDVLDENMAQYLKSSSDNPIPGLIRRSWEILKDHSINSARRRAGLKEANSIWLWGQGRAPKIPQFVDRYGLKGGVVSAVDLIQGIGIYAGFTPIHIEGARGFLNTNYRGKAEGALKWLKDLDLIFLHVEAPDEAGHSGNFNEKIEAIENFDQLVVGNVLKGLEKYEDYRIMVISDHLTPVSKKTHTNEPTPFAWATKSEMRSIPKGSPFTERAAKESGLMVDVGHELMKGFLSDL